MDELEISGKRYISAKRIAKENKYHPDYVGQLIRAGRILGTKVGRAWYVDEASFAEYLGKERGTFQPAPVAEVAQVAPLAEVVAAPTPTPEPTQNSSQNQSSPESGKSTAADFPTSDAVASPYIPDELGSAPAPETFAIVEPAYVPGKVAPVFVRETAKVFVQEIPQPQVVKEFKIPVKTSLTYIPDNSPLFPAIQRRSKPVEIKKEVRVEAEIASPIRITQREKRSTWKTSFALVSLVLVAGIVFSFSFFGSLGINSTTIVEKGKPASVALSQEKTFCFIFGNCQK